MYCIVYIQWILFILLYYDIKSSSQNFQSSLLVGLQKILKKNNKNYGFTAGQYWSSVLFPANYIDRDSGLLPLSILVDEDKGIS